MPVMLSPAFFQERSEGHTLRYAHASTHVHERDANIFFKLWSTINREPEYDDGAGLKYQLVASACNSLQQYLMYNELKADDNMYYSVPLYRLQFRHSGTSDRVHTSMLDELALSNG